MTTSTKPAKRTSRRRKAADNTFGQQFKGMEILAEVICWSARKDGDLTKTHSHRDVLAALKKVGLDASLAPDILPKSAFSRACKELENSRSIHVLSRDVPTTRFQFTTEFLDTKRDEWLFKKEGIIILNETTGEISSSTGNTELVKQAQSLLDLHTQVRTTTDITNIVQGYFEGKSDLIPFREQGGSYIVMSKDRPLVDQMQGFLEALGGRMKRLPIPKGDPVGDLNVQECLSDFATNLIREHKKAVDGFSINTRNDTIEREAERINETRQRIQGYAILLEEQKEELLKVVEQANQHLLSKVNGFNTEREADPTKPRGEKSSKPKLFGHKLVAIIRWMRYQNWSKKDGIKVLAHYKFSQAMNTWNTQYWRAETYKNSTDPKKKKDGEPAKLTDKEEKELRKVYKEVCGS